MGPCATDLLRHGLQTLVPRGLGPQTRGVLVPGNAPSAALWRFSGETKKSGDKFAFPEKMLYLCNELRTKL